MLRAPARALGHPRSGRDDGAPSRERAVVTDPHGPPSPPARCRKRRRANGAPPRPALAGFLVRRRTPHLVGMALDRSAAPRSTRWRGATPASSTRAPDALQALAGSGVPFLVAGAYAFFEYTGIFRDTKDLDVFLRERDLDEAFRVLERAGFRTEIDRPGLDRQGVPGRVVRGPHLLVRATASRWWTTSGSSTRARPG